MTDGEWSPLEAIDWLTVLTTRQYRPHRPPTAPAGPPSRCCYVSAVAAFALSMHVMYMSFNVAAALTLLSGPGTTIVTFCVCVCLSVCVSDNNSHVTWQNFHEFCKKELANEPIRYWLTVHQYHSTSVDTWRNWHHMKSNFFDISPNYGERSVWSNDWLVQSAPKITVCFEE